jgi:tRNA-binding protein
MLPETTFDEFAKSDIRVGRIVAAEPFPEGRSSTHVLEVDLGDELGRRKSLARLAPTYGYDELVGKQVLCLVNLPERQIGPHRSQVLTLGVPGADGHVVLIVPDTDVPLGGRLY